MHTPKHSSNHIHVHLHNMYHMRSITIGRNPIVTNIDTGNRISLLLFFVVCVFYVFLMLCHYVACVCVPVLFVWLCSCYYYSLSVVFSMLSLLVIVMVCFVVIIFCDRGVFVCLNLSSYCN